MKKKIFIYIFLSFYIGTFLRIFINNNLILSLIGSFFVGFVIAKKLSYLKEKIILSGFFSCFTSFSGFIFFIISYYGEWIKFIIFLI